MSYLFGNNIYFYMQIPLDAATAMCAIYTFAIILCCYAKQTPEAMILFHTDILMSSMSSFQTDHHYTTYGYGTSTNVDMFD